LLLYVDIVYLCCHSEEVMVVIARSISDEAISF